MTARLTSRTLAAVTDDAAGRVVDEALVNTKILDAEAVFHSYASVYYSVPITEPTENVRVARKTVIDLAAWELLSRRPHAISGEVGDTERARNEATLAWLRGLAARDRRVQLTGSPERTSPVPPSGGATVIAEPPQFPLEALSDY
jgi:phage gp36-like protein